MGGGPTTTTDTNQSQTANNSTASNTSGQNVTQGTNLQRGVETGQTYGVNQGQTANVSQGNTSGYSTTGAYAPTEPVLQSIAQQAGMLAGSSALTGGESTALAGLKGQASTNADLNPLIGSAAHDNLMGGSFGAGDSKVNEGYDIGKSANMPYANGSMLDFNNPQLRAAMDTVQEDVTNNIAGQFAGAGRSMGTNTAAANAVSRGQTSAMAPLMLDYLYKQQGAQRDAGNSIAGLGVNAGSAINQSAAGKLSAQTAAPGMLSTTYDPYSTMLSGEQIGRKIPLDQLKSVNDLVMPMGQAFGENISLGSQQQVGSGTSQGTQAGGSQNTSTQLTQNDVMNLLNTLSNSTSNGTTTGTGTSTTSQQNDPLSMFLGAASMLGGAYLGGPAMAA